jgi:hypothetical protein
MPAAATFRLSTAPYVCFMWPIWLIFRLLSCLRVPKEELLKQDRKALAQQLALGRAVVVAVGAGAGGDQVEDMVENLIELQRVLPFPLIVCPLHVVWSRTPLDTDKDPLPTPHTRHTTTSNTQPSNTTTHPDHPATGTYTHVNPTTNDNAAFEPHKATPAVSPAASRRTSYWEILFGSRRCPGALRTLLSMVRGRRELVSIGGGAPVMRVCVCVCCVCVRMCMHIADLRIHVYSLSLSLSLAYTQQIHSHIFI